jgi:hypothetical protein
VTIGKSNIGQQKVIRVPTYILLFPNIGIVGPGPQWSKNHGTHGFYDDPIWVDTQKKDIF